MALPSISVGSNAWMPHAVQRRGAVQQHRVVLDDLLEDVPDLVVLALEHLLRRLDRVGVAQFLEPTDDERLVQFERDLLRQPALVEPEVGADHDHRPGRVIHPLAQEVLAEPTLLALDHVGERLERAVARPEHGPLATVVIEQRVNRLLEHPLLVADDDLGRVEVDKLLEPVVAVDDPSIEVVEVARREVARIEEHERPEVGGNDRDRFEDHPLGPVVAVAERLDDLEPLGEVFGPLLAGGLAEFLAKLLREADEVEPREELADGVGPHVGLEGVSVGFSIFAEIVLGKELPFFQGGVTGVDDDVILEVDDPFHARGLHVEQGTQAAGHCLEEPDMDDGRGQFDMPHAFASDAAMRDLDAATVADHPLVLHPSISIATCALPST